MSRYTLFICRSQTEAIGLRRHLAQMGVPGEVTQPPRHARTESCGWAVRIPSTQATDAVQQLRLLGIAPCRVLPDGEDGL